jgi:hypothetical protein
MMSINEVLQSAYELSLEERIELTKLLNENIEDPMLQMDPYFYERREELHKLRADIRSGKMKMYPFEDLEKEMDEFEKELEIKYAN